MCALPRSLVFNGRNKRAQAGEKGSGAIDTKGSRELLNEVLKAEEKRNKAVQLAVTQVTPEGGAAELKCVHQCAII